ncbi:helix-turn-helix transcriptional regulator [Paenibacillus terricola]|uniref:helix-turn-helix transcriptional regulator n=1 Tax=Paenibacillus terricola TaxID=2763503 RepID=UPI0029653E26|nr:helix-turn-helix transcriptional regulator [Paenibacillus terricola]
MVHRTSELSEPNHERAVLHYDLPFFDGLAPEDTALLLGSFAASHPIIRLNIHEQLHVETLLGSLLGELNDRPPGHLLHIRNKSIELLLYIARYIMKRKAVPDNIAKKFFISKGHLCRVFKEVSGFGFSQYINITRIREAEHLLRTTDWSITHISEQCGFENFSHFGRVFKKLVGMSPREFRGLEG